MSGLSFHLFCTCCDQGPAEEGRDAFSRMMEKLKAELTVWTPRSAGAA